MFSTAAFLLWVVLPPLGWLFRKWIPGLGAEGALVYLAVVAAGSILYVAGIWLVDKELEYAVNRFDRDGNGEFSEEEFTPAADEAMRKYTADTGRRFAPLFAAPVTLVYATLWFGVLYAGSWVFGWGYFLVTRLGE